MNSDVLKGKWKQLKGEAQKQWGKITDDEFDQIEGDATKLAGMVQERYGKTREQAEEEVNSWRKRQNAA
ncbi:MAG: CsbD family protein [Rickettsiales bacterium]